MISGYIRPEAGVTTKQSILECSLTTTSLSSRDCKAQFFYLLMETDAVSPGRSRGYCRLEIPKCHLRDAPPGDG